MLLWLVVHNLVGVLAGGLLYESVTEELGFRAKSRARARSVYLTSEHRIAAQDIVASLV